MKLTKQPVRQTAGRNLRTSVGRPASRYAKDDYEEPNVRLSRAFIVVLLLHVVAVGGIFTFSALKDRQITRATAKPNTDSARPLAATKAVQKVTSTTHKVKQGETLSGIAFEYGINVRDLEQANALKAGTQVNAGRELIIPEKAGITNVP
ncbi:MAG: LysM peptidoglycan-binding domain-containing protein, partial [Verrucomicrobia bacterium]|nr:LysM peptidoglycan-binding domain-containing protein [Verrucomicrobiota bacterium]